MTSRDERAYDELVAHLREMALVASCQELLAWDELTYLPDEGTEHRARQLGYLAGQHHGLATDRRLDEWLAALDGSPLVADSHSPAATNLREARRQHQRLARLPRRLVEELARVTTIAQHHWALARKGDDFRRLAPWLSQVVQLKREEAQCLADGPDLYDALLGEYEPGLRTADVARLLAELGQSLAALVPRILDAQSRCEAAGQPSPLRGNFPELGQRVICQTVAAALGFDLQRGRIDTAVHPFTTNLGPRDCRIAIRYDEGHLRVALYALLHELGHALYDQGLPGEHFGTPAGEAISLGVHESQARLWENAVGRSLGFWRYLLPRIRAAFPGQLDGATPEALWRSVNRVQPGVNRVGADEATYNLHILLRFELEQQLVFGELPVADIPEAWNRRSAELVGIAPGSAREGCLQDGHWAAGQFGYFPTYTIGNVLAAQLFARIRQDLGDVEALFAAGNFAPLRSWLHEHLYRHGKVFTTLELTHHLLARPLDPQPLVAMLDQRHQQLWHP
jgi:carboxypeptidase Taq